MRTSRRASGISLAQALGAAGPNPGGAFVLRRVAQCEDASSSATIFGRAAIIPPASAASEGLKRIRVIESTATA